MSECINHVYLQANRVFVLYLIGGLSHNFENSYFME